MRHSLFSIVLLFSSFIKVSAAEKIDLLEAFKTDKVSYKLQSNGNGLREGMLTISIQNNTKKKLEVLIPAGQTYICSEDERQNLIQVEELLVELNSNASLEKELLTMCTERSDNSPGDSIIYSLGKKANGNLLICAEYLNTNSKWDYAGQSAIWVFSNNTSVSYIHGNDPVTNSLRTFAANLSGQEETWYTVNYEGNGQLSNSFTNKERKTNYQKRINGKLNKTKSSNSKKENSTYQNRINKQLGGSSQMVYQKSFDRNLARVEGTFEYTVKDISKAKFGIFDSEGNLIDLFFENKDVMPGIHKFHFYLEASDIPPGKYFAKMYVNNELLVQRTVEF